MSPHHIHIICPQIICPQITKITTPGARGNLMAHGDEKSLRADAQALAAFLKIPVLDEESA